MAVELLEVKFRLYDGTDIGPNKYALSATVASLKESILSQWPKDKEHNPRTINDIKLISAGKILENNKTLAESRVPVGEIPGAIVTMHVVVRPPASEKGPAPRLKCFLGWTWLLLLLLRIVLLFEEREDDLL